MEKRIVRVRRMAPRNVSRCIGMPGLLRWHVRRSSRGTKEERRLRSEASNSECQWHSDQAACSGGSFCQEMAPTNHTRLRKAYGVACNPPTQPTHVSNSNPTPTQPSLQTPAKRAHQRSGRSPGFCDVKGAPVGAISVPESPRDGKTDRQSAPDGAAQREPVHRYARLVTMACPP